MPDDIKIPLSKSLRAKTCAAQLFGSWMIEPKWFAQAVDAVRSGKLQPKTAKDDGDEEKEKPRLTIAEIDNDYGDDEEKGYKVRTVNNKRIAVICIEGTMLKYRSSFGGCSTVEVRRAVRAASNDRMVDAIMLYVDSPGGSCSGTSDLASDIKIAAGRKPLWSFIANMGASAGYWVASQADQVWANEIALVGSIGTYCVLTDETKWQEEIGIKLTVVSTGPYKGLGADGKVTDQLVSDVQREINDLNERFLLAVADGRGLGIDKVRTLADGRVHVGEKAVHEGMVNVIGTFDAALQALSQEKPKMITQDQFDAYAAAHPDATKPFVQKGIDQASKQPATPQQLAEAFPNDPAFAMSQLTSGASILSALTAGHKHKDEAAAAKDKKHADELAAKDAVIAEKDKRIAALEHDLTGQAPVNSNAAQGQVDKAKADKQQQEAAKDEAEFAKIADPKARAAAEWKANFGDCQKDFQSEQAYVGYRVADLQGRVKQPRRGE